MKLYDVYVQSGSAKKMVSVMARDWIRAGKVGQRVVEKIGWINCEVSSVFLKSSGVTVDDGEA